MKSKIYKIGIPVGIAVLAIAVVASFGAHQIAMAQGGFFMHHGGPHGFHGPTMYDMPEITGTLPVKESISENIDSVKVDALVAGAIAAESIEDGKVLLGGILPWQDYLVYQYVVVSSDDHIYKVIVDAGNGEILHTSEGISLDVLDTKIASMKEKFGKDGFHYGKHFPM